MLRLIVCFFILLAGCNSVIVPKDFLYKDIETNTFALASWQKIGDKNSVVKIYIEGDGASFDAYGMPTKDPTPKGRLIRELAFGDMSSNVVYLARPCQFAMNDMCSVRHWTTARFSYEVIDSTYEAIKNIAKDREIILIGFSGGAQVASLVAVLKRDLRIKKVITIAGNLDHLAWTQYHKISHLSESLNLSDYKNEYFKIPQKHYVGGQDNVVPSSLVFDFVKDKNIDVEVVEKATHSKGWDAVYDEIWKEK
jgi:hypothetical protein